MNIDHSNYDQYSFLFMVHSHLSKKRNQSTNYDTTYFIKKKKKGKKEFTMY